ncbi:hypothetical protein HEP74_01455 [Xanthomonas sp. SS]|uniref:hypothetical protein n=1 Tax=Xanthomonas sp. SS TaxID=2724122 RepID=UPI00163A5123|nr:hypothetical protein [Xanthomonas sp. SS]QNH16330.1 hypothetical protein HEP74_01455 [Xanthomonas sp. SS]
MSITTKRNGWSGPVLVVALCAAIVIFGKPARYSIPVSLALSAIQLLAMAIAAAPLLLRAWRSGDEHRRRIALVGTLLILPWALLTLMPGYGPPFASNLAMNHVRFVILFVSAAVLGAGLFLLKEPLADAAGDRLLAPLGQASGLFAALIQLVWAALMIGWTMSEAHKPAAYLPLYGTPLGNAADVLLFFAGLMTYVSTALYALSFARQGWLRPAWAGIIASVAALAVVALMVRGLQYPDLPDDWFAMPGMIVGIPAIPWLMPYLLGVCALVHAAHGPKVVA